MVSNGKQRRPVNGKRRAAAGNGDRPTILIVDDEPAIRVLLDAALDGEGYRLLEAADGPSALEAARTEHPDLVLLDIGLPGLSGLEVCRRLRDEAGTAGTPVLFLTGLGREAEEEAAAQSAKYAPLGYRGMFGGRQAFGVADYVHQANDQTLVVVLIEEIEALKNLDEILRVDYIDVFFVAPSDLSQTMGHIGDTGHPDVQKAIDEAIAKIVSSGRVAGTLVNDDNLAGYLDKGVKFVMTSWNGWVTRGATQFMANVAANVRT